MLSKPKKFPKNGRLAYKEILRLEKEWGNKTDVARTYYLTNYPDGTWEANMFTTTVCHADVKYAIAGNSENEAFNYWGDMNDPDEKYEYVYPSFLVDFLQTECVTSSYKIAMVKPPKEQYLRYIDYLINRSPYSFMYYNTDAEQVWKDRCLVIRTNVEASYTWAAILHTKDLGESSYVIDTWCALVDRGIREDVAFQMSAFTCRRGKTFEVCAGSYHRPALVTDDLNYYANRAVYHLKNKLSWKGGEVRVNSNDIGRSVGLAPERFYKTVDLEAPVARGFYSVDVTIKGYSTYHTLDVEDTAKRLEKLIDKFKGEAENA